MENSMFMRGSFSPSPSAGVSSRSRSPISVGERNKGTENRTSGKRIYEFNLDEAKPVQFEEGRQAHKMMTAIKRKNESAAQAKLQDTPDTPDTPASMPKGPI